MVTTQAFDEADKQAVAAVAGSTYRSRVLRAVREESGTSGDVATRVSIARPNVSRAMSELAELGCLELLAPDDAVHGRVYRITDRGERVLAVVPGGKG